jgi:hypothetical protein
MCLIKAVFWDGSGRYRYPPRGFADNRTVHIRVGFISLHNLFSLGTIGATNGESLRGRNLLVVPDFTTGTGFPLSLAKLRRD